MDSTSKEKSPKAFTVKGFYSYSRKRKEVERKLETKCQELSNEFLPKKFLQRLLGPTDIWKVFFKQADAFNFVHKTRLNLHVFAFESPSFTSENQGMRMYLAVTYPVFWHYYRQLAEEHRHHYEIIPQGSVCKLYFDLEFYRKFNPTLEDGYGLCRIFIKYVCAWLKEIFSINCDAERHILVLDASTDNKYSEHLIFLLPNVAFKDNYQVGSFVRFISTRLVLWLKDDTQPPQEQKDVGGSYTAVDPSFTEKARVLGQESKDNKTEDRGLFESLMNPENGKSFIKYLEKNVFSLFTKEELQKLVVKDKNTEDTLLCDLGVYTKNRNFRLFLSRKLGHENPLLVSRHNRFTPSGGTTTSTENEKIFFHSLIANVEDPSNVRILMFEEEKPIKLGQRNLQIKNPDFSAEEGETSDPSPYPEVDVFIRSLVSSNERQGRIRHWYYFMEGNLLIYDIVGYRWCANVKRQHKSNNIRLLVDLKKCVYYQKCYDPVCKEANFCSEYYKLPSDVLPWLADLSEDTIEDFEMDSEELDDDSLIFAAETMEKIHDDSMIEDDNDDDDLLISATEVFDEEPNMEKISDKENRLVDDQYNKEIH